MKKAVMYGGGNIGRGFIGMLLSASGYEVTFIDVAETVVNALNEKHCYPVRIISGDMHEDISVQNVKAVNGNDTEAAAQAIADADIMATAVGARILPYIVPNIVAGLRKRRAQNGGPLNIIICENLMDANKVLEGLLKEKLTAEECERFDAEVGLVEASIGRMVPVQTEEMKDGDPMRVCVEEYGYLPVDKDAFKGEIPEIRSMVPFAPFDFYIKRKLYIHNMGHAVCAYLGDHLGIRYISEAIDIPEVRVLVQNAMIESAMALSARYGVALSEIQQHITDLLYRFTNAALKDTCMRVGGDPARKLSPDDRLIGSAKLALAEGILPVYIAAGAAAGVCRYISENGGAAEEILCEVSGLSGEGPLKALILEFCGMLKDGCSIKELLKAADGRKHEGLGNVI